MPQTKQSFLKGRTTGYLLKQYRFMDKDHYRLCCGDIKESEVGFISLWDENSKQEFVFSANELKAELATRPHLSNKLERRRNRA